MADGKLLEGWEGYSVERVEWPQEPRRTLALKPYPRSVQVGEFEVAISGGVWVAIRAVWWSCTKGLL